MMIPKCVQIETITGACTARCIMCNYKTWKRPRHIMSQETFVRILERLAPIRDHLEYMNLFFLGEPLLDNGLTDKVRAAKQRHFRSVGFSTNATLLTEAVSMKLIEAGLDTLIFSLDSLRKAVHETIRSGTDFDAVVGNIRTFIRLRNRLGRTKIILRFIRQALNRDEWEAYFNHWMPQLDPARGDSVVKYDAHNWGGSLEHYDEIAPNGGASRDRPPCDEIFRRLIIYSNGDVGFCCADENGHFSLGNVLKTDVLDIFNNETFSHYRRMMQAGRIGELDFCRNCSLPRAHPAERTMTIKEIP